MYFLAKLQKLVLKRHTELTTTASFMKKDRYGSKFVRKTNYFSPYSDRLSVKQSELVY